MRLAAARPAFHRPRTLAEACELLAADERAMAYGGGTAIEVRRRQIRRSPRRSWTWP
jgi:CO/xanthine dehydrogenase FAD-binding subunit